jgi:L-ascorbate metabolism protein UlaG (beta-lactamase superfamily)
MRILATVLLLLTMGVAQAQDKSIKLRYFGHACFQVEAPNGKKIVFDPHLIAAFSAAKPEADLLLISHEHDDHGQIQGIANFKDKPKTLRGLKPAGINRFDWNPIDEKWEGIRIRTFGTYHDEVDGTKRGKNSMFLIDIDGFVICHCGDLGHEFTEKQVKAIGPVDVLLVPVGGIYTLNGRTAVDVVDQIKPRLYAVPMHYGIEGFDDLQNPEEFFEGMMLNKKPIKKMTDKYELEIPLKAKAEGYTVLNMGWKKVE